MDGSAYFAMFAAYNNWANRRLYAAARSLPDAEYRRERGAFFGSLHRTLNHLLVTDRLMLRRMKGEGPPQNRLDDILFEDLGELAVAREAQDTLISEFVAGLGDADMDRTITFRTVVAPEQITQRLDSALGHYFNHQTHHRGQAHALVTMAAGNVAMPSLDLIYFQRETRTGLL